MIALYVIIDSIFVGRGVGKEALAALNIAYPMITISSAISLMIGMGASTLMSLYHGKKHLEALCLSYIHCLNLLFYVILIFLVFFCSKWLLWILGGQTNLQTMILGYLYPCSVGMIFLMISTGWNAAVRNLGAPKYAFFSMLAGALCNVFFDWIFIFPMQLGIQGAAIATSMGQIVSFFLLFFFFRNKRIFIPLLPRKISWSLLQRLFSIGFSSFIMEFSAAIV
ncbi:MAG TPA: MATE family efflux transporter, partial [Fusobacterium sp.]